MTSRERVIAAIEFSGPDRIPHNNAFVPAVFRKYGRKVEELLGRFPSDFAGADEPPDESAFRTGRFTDEWGCMWEVSLPGFGGQVVVHPLSDWKALRRGTATLCPYSSPGSGRLRELLGGKVCFQALPDVQFTLRHGSPEDARRHAKDMMAALGSFDGGFISCCELHPDLPWENMVAILETFHEYGRYPLRLAWAGDHAVEI